MATSIPYDPTLVLGNIVDTNSITALQEIAKMQYPIEMAADRLRNLTRQLYKIQMLIQQMIGMNPLIPGMPAAKSLSPNVKKLKEEEKQLKQKVAKATVDYAKAQIKGVNEIYKIGVARRQTKIGFVPESPLDYAACEPTAFPLAFDSLKFDVQFFQNESNDETSLSLATSVSNYVGTSMRAQDPSTGLGARASNEMSTSAHASMTAQMTKHVLEGTIVIIAHVTHKNALMIDPFIMDPLKCVRAWNSLHPQEAVRTDPSSIFEAAMEPMREGQSTMSLLSGCSLGSSFVGFVHILRQEHSVSTQLAASVASAVKTSVGAELKQAAMTGDYGCSTSIASSAKAMLSNSRLNNHAGLICMGIIPNIKCNTILTTVQTMQPDPQKTMQQLAAIKSASDGMNNNTMEGQAGDAKRGKQFAELSTGHIDGVVSAVAPIQDDSNKVIDTNSMFTAFTDFVEKAAQGDAGVPLTFYIKEVRKSDVAKCYINKFYQNGARTSADALKGQFGVG